MSAVKIRYALSRSSEDHWPVIFRPDCERTFCDGYGESEGLLEMKLRLNKTGYDLVDSRDELIKILVTRKALEEK